MATHQFGYDLRTAFEVLTKGGPFWWKFSHWALPFDAPVIRRTLEALERELGRRQAKHFDKVDDHFAMAVLFIKGMLDSSSDERLERSWRVAMKGLDGINAYDLGSATKKRSKLESIAADQRTLAAWQAAAVGSGWVMKSLLALLVLDGSTESIDALLPHVERAKGDRVRLAQLEAVRPYANKKSTEALFEATQDALRAESHVLALGRQFGLEKQGRVRVRVRILGSERRERGVTERVFAEIELDSNDATECVALVTHERSTATSTSSRSESLRCRDVRQLPRALARAAKKHALSWNFESARTTFATRAQCNALLKWLAANAS